MRDGKDTNGGARNKRIQGGKGSNGATTGINKYIALTLTKDISCWRKKEQRRKGDKGDKGDAWPTWPTDISFMTNRY